MCERDSSRNLGQCVCVCVYGDTAVTVVGGVLGGESRESGDGGFVLTPSDERERGTPKRNQHITSNRNRG